MTDRIRRATASDYAAYAVLFRELAIDDPVASAERFAIELAPRILIYERDGQAIGYVSFQMIGGSGYIQNLVVAQGARGVRIGEALMAAAAGELRARGVSGEWHLNVEAGNAAAIRLYERLGLRPRYHTTALRLPWASLDRLPPNEATVMILPVPEGDDEDIERALGILGGRLQLARARPGRVILQLRDGHHAPVGVACFDPAFPNAFPFATARPGLAAALLHALSPHARPGQDDLQVVVEHDEPLVGALVAAGAKVRLRLLSYAGPLPSAR